MIQYPNELLPIISQLSVSGLIFLTLIFVISIPLALVALVIAFYVITFILIFSCCIIVFGIVIAYEWYKYGKISSNINITKT